MMKSSSVTVFAVLALASATVTADEGGQVGRYQGVEASESAVWVVDTRTGRVRKCTQEFSDTPPVCSAYSK